MNENIYYNVIYIYIYSSNIAIKEMYELRLVLNPVNWPPKSIKVKYFHQLLCKFTGRWGLVYWVGYCHEIFTVVIWITYNLRIWWIKNKPISLFFFLKIWITVFF